jgi:hypothetical protein
MAEVKPDLPGIVPKLEITLYCVRDHPVQLGQIISLGRNSASFRIIPPGDESTAFGADLDVKQNLAHTEHTMPYNKGRSSRK